MKIAPVQCKKNMITGRGSNETPVNAHQPIVVKENIPSPIEQAAKG